MPSCPRSVIIDDEHRLAKYTYGPPMEAGNMDALNTLQWFSIPLSVESGGGVPLRESYGPNVAVYSPVRRVRLLNLGCSATRRRIVAFWDLPIGMLDPDKMYQGTDDNRVVHNAIRAAFGDVYDGTFISGDDVNLTDNPTWEGAEEIVLWSPFVTKLKRVY